MYNKKMLDQLLVICCYFNYHPKSRLVDVKIGFGSSGKIEKVECRICKKVFIRGKKEINLNIVLIAILLFFILLLFF